MNHIKKIASALVLSAFASSAMAAKYELLIPTYFNPKDTAKWDAVTNAAKKIPVIAIANPNSGPGNAVSEEWVSRINSLKAAGVKVLGYVPTGYGKRPLQDIQADLATFASWYDIDGFFLDEFISDAITPEQATQYKNIVDSARSSGAGSKFVVGNPGINADEKLLSMVNADAIISFEDKASNYLKNADSAWTAGYPSGRFGNMVYSAGDLTQSLKKFVGNNVKYVYITNDGGTNPWDTVAAYIDAEASILAAFNNGENIDFDLPFVSYKIARASRYNRPPAIFTVRPTVIGGLASERNLKYSFVIDGQPVDTKGKLAPLTILSSGDHQLEINATTPKGKVISSKSVFSVGENQLPTCKTTSTWDKTGKAALIRANCLDVDGRIKSVRWYLDGINQNKPSMSFIYAPPAASAPSLELQVDDDSGGTASFTIDTVRR